MTVADIGSGMGYFSLPMAALVGSKGKVVCVDLQEKMLSSLIKRARKAGVSDRIVTKRAEKNSLNLGDMAGSADFVLAFALIHEVPDQERLLQEIYGLLKQNGCLLISEPKGHVTRQEFSRTISLALAMGFKSAATPDIWREHSMVLAKAASL
jgi:ubiquinone/menaquinone biosynthesis C-methylase UbiE